ncbi:hypothetical protein [Rhodobacter capsulatus]|nr:hypothetical protein [Rhodobacter capsulatus]
MTPELVLPKGVAAPKQGALIRRCCSQMGHDRLAGSERLKEAQ